MEALAVACRNFENAIVGHEEDDVAGGIHYGRADLAVFEMAVDLSAQHGIHIAVDIRRDILPNVFAIDLHTRLPNHPRFAAGAKALSDGVRSFCNIARARCNLTLTAPSVIPSTCALSCTSSSSTSRSWTTSR